MILDVLYILELHPESMIICMSIIEHMLNMMSLQNLTTPLWIYCILTTIIRRIFIRVFSILLRLNDIY
jgi:hypothetical protein